MDTANNDDININFNQLRSDSIWNHIRELIESDIDNPEFKLIISNFAHICSVPALTEKNPQSLSYLYVDIFNGLTLSILKHLETNSISEDGIDFETIINNALLYHPNIASEEAYEIGLEIINLKPEDENIELYNKNRTVISQYARFLQIYKNQKHLSINDFMKGLKVEFPSVGRKAP